VEQNQKTTFQKIDTIRYERWFHRIVSHWHLFFIAAVISGLGCYLYLRYTNTVYSLSATVLVKDVSQNINPLDPTMRQESPYRTFNLNNEIKIFQSKRLIEETVRNMDWRATYWIKGQFKDTEVYKFSAFHLLFLDSNNAIPYNTKIKLIAKANGKFTLLFKENDDSESGAPAYEFNKELTINGFTFIVQLPEGGSAPAAGSKYIIVINTLQGVIGEFSGKVRVMQYDKNSSILSVNTQGTCVEREKDFINSHCLSFVKISLNDKNQTQERTIGFIDNQLELISDTLTVLENRMILYRKKFNSSNVESIAEKRFLKLEMLEEEKLKNALNQRYFDYLKKYIKEQSQYTDIVAPSVIGIPDANLNKLLQELVELKMKQNTSFKTENLQSPFRVDNENKINQIKKNIIEVIKNIENSNQLLYADINNRIVEVTRLTSSILDNERNYIELKRKYKINEELYNILLKKKSELAITRAGNVSDTKIIDNAYVSGTPYPVASKVYSTNIVIALMLPLAFVLFKYISNYRIMEKDDITNVCNMPFLGSIGHIPDETKMIMVNKPKSSLAESFRSIRANLYYFLPKPDQKVILITSSLSAEGKTFSSVNISSALAVSGKKIVLVGADLRKPKIYLDLNTRGQLGLSNYLVNKATIEEITMTTEVENFYFISSGSIPPNPAELIASPKMYELIMELKKIYDYVVVDTPPIGLVTDALPLMQFSDINIYIVRHGYTQTKFLKDLNEMVQNGIVKNLVYIFNDYDISKNYGYGYKYGYYRSSKYGSGYYEDVEKKRNWWQSLRAIFKRKRY